MSSATLANINGLQAKNPDMTITVNRADLKSDDDGHEHV
jgi:hypothetical protein